MCSPGHGLNYGCVCPKGEAKDNCGLGKKWISWENYCSSVWDEKISSLQCFGPTTVAVKGICWWNFIKILHEREKFFTTSSKTRGDIFEHWFCHEIHVLNFSLMSNVEMLSGQIVSQSFCFSLKLTTLFVLEIWYGRNVKISFHADLVEIFTLCRPMVEHIQL